MRLLSSAVLAAVLITGAMPAAAITLSAKDEARIDRAPRRDRADVRRCLSERKRGQNKGLAGGAAAGGVAGAVGGGNLGSALLGAGAGALAGNFLGKGAGTDRYCDDVLRRNR